MHSLIQTCNKSDIHAALRIAMTEPLLIDQSQCLKSNKKSSSSSSKRGPSLTPEKMRKIRQAITRINTTREVLPEQVDSRALQPALKMIGMYVWLDG